MVPFLAVFKGTPKGKKAQAISEGSFKQTKVPSFLRTASGWLRAKRCLDHVRLHGQGLGHLGHDASGGLDLVHHHLGARVLLPFGHVHAVRRPTEMNERTRLVGKKAGRFWRGRHFFGVHLVLFFAFAILRVVPTAIKTKSK